VISTTTTATAARPKATPAESLRLDDLLGRPLEEIEALYRDAKVPALDDVRGDLRGRMLATTVLGGRWVKRAERWASSRFFPWRGKSFMPRDANAGEGINRVGIDRLRLYRFETRIDASKAGDFDALQLDYDLPDNPGVIRAIEDEIRELSPGLWLGQAYLRIGGQPVLILYFGLTSE
jgi:hypothetical protein